MDKKRVECFEEIVDVLFFVKVEIENRVICQENLLEIHILAI